MPYPMDGEQHLVHVPRVARPRTPAPELIGIGLSECPAPLPDRFVGDDDATGAQQLFDVPVAEAEAVVQPDAMTHNFGWKTMVCVALRSRGTGHAFLPLCLPT